MIDRQDIGVALLWLRRGYPMKLIAAILGTDVKTIRAVRDRNVSMAHVSRVEHCPTPDQIARKASRIRECWTAEEEYLRRRKPRSKDESKPWTPPIVSGWEIQ